MSPSVSVFTTPERYPYSAAEFKVYQKVVKATGGKHDGWEAAPKEGLYYWWAFFKNAKDARKGVAALKSLSFQASLKHPAPWGKKPLFPPNLSVKKKNTKRRTSKKA